MSADNALQRMGRIARLAWPILIGQVAVIANGVIDTAMTSRFSATDLAALGLGASIYVSIFVGLSGVLQALSPIVSQLYGARRLQEIGPEVRQGVWLGLFLCVPGCLLLCFPAPFLSLAQASPELAEKTTLYLRMLALALPATLAFRLYASLNVALSRPKMVMAIQIAAVLLKVPLNLVFIFGMGAIPAMGGPGCALSTTLLAWLSLAAGLLVLRRGEFYRPLGLFDGRFPAPHWPSQRALLKLGVPMGLSYLIEVTAFTFMAIFVARLGETALAGHQIAANFGILLYMLPLSVAYATTALTAQAVGAGDLAQARRIGNAGIGLAALLATAMGCVVWLAQDAIVAGYTSNPVIAAAALPLFLFIAFYQLFDALQVSTAFVLRAYKVVTVPTVVYAVSLWGVGLGSGYLLGLNPLGISPPALRGAAGFWLATSVSLALAGAGLLWYLKTVQRRVESGVQPATAAAAAAR